MVRIVAFLISVTLGFASAALARAMLDVPAAIRSVATAAITIAIDFPFIGPPRDRRSALAMARRVFRPVCAGSRLRVPRNGGRPRKRALLSFSRRRDRHLR